MVSIAFITARICGLLISLNWLLKEASGVAGSFFGAFPRIATTLRLLILGRRAVDISTLSEFQYSRLEGARGIRLLVLQPGRISDEISCTLKIVSLDERPSFEALSYTWGDPAEKRPIQCGNGSLYVTVNLYSTLRHLQYMYRNRVLWAVAVCLYFDRYRTEYVRNLSFGPLFSEGSCSTSRINLSVFVLSYKVNYIVYLIS